MWYQQADFTRVQYLQHGLSDHTPLLLQLLNSPRPSKTFQFCDMWTRHPTFFPMVTSSLRQAQGRLDVFLSRLQFGLRKLNREHYADLREQQHKA